MGILLRYRASSPVNQFKRLLGKVELKLDSFQWEGICKRNQDTPLSYNIIETKSLVSPFVATLRFQLQFAGTRNVVSRDFEATYAFQDSKWVLKDNEPISHDLSVSVKELEDFVMSSAVELAIDVNRSPQSKAELHQKFDMAGALILERRVALDSGLRKALSPDD